MFCSGLCADGAASGIGLLELLINAVEHGNLGITYAEKSQLRLEGTWEQEIERRLGLAPWTQRRACLNFRRESNEIEFVIRDEGEGFSWEQYLEMSPERAFDLNGRGIAMAKMLGFDRMEYQGKGNIVVVRTKAATFSS